MSRQIFRNSRQIRFSINKLGFSPTRQKHVSNEPNTCPTCAASQTRAGKKAYKKVVDNRNTFNLRPCHTRQFVLPTCNTISAKKILQFQTLFTCLRPAMRLYCRTAEYLKMSAAFRLCRIVIGSFSKNCKTSCSGGVTRCNLSRTIAKLLLLSLKLATQFFVARLVANMGCHTRNSSLQLAMQHHCVARIKENFLV